MKTLEIQNNHIEAKMLKMYEELEWLEKMKQNVALIKQIQESVRSLKYKMKEKKDLEEALEVKKLTVEMMRKKDPFKEFNERVEDLIQDASA